MGNIVAGHNLIARACNKAVYGELILFLIVSKKKKIEKYFVIAIIVHIISSLVVQV